MANKKSNKKKAQAKPESQAAAPKQASKKDVKKAAADKKAPVAKKAAKKKADKKPGIFARGKAYLASVRTEMKRVVWPTKKELVNYTIAVCASLLVVGVVIAVLDAVIGGGLVLFAGLRG